jgi:antibiotic biosynthesis monooxygenase (ABM) superfamily enzyme
MSTLKQPAAGPRVPPPRHKMALLTWPGSWALITLILWVLGPVTSLTWLVIPNLTRVFAGWLAPTPPNGRQREATSPC